MTMMTAAAAAPPLATNRILLTNDVCLSLCVYKKHMDTLLVSCCFSFLLFIGPWKEWEKKLYELRTIELDVYLSDCIEFEINTNYQHQKNLTNTQTNRTEPIR